MNLNESSQIIFENEELQRSGAHITQPQLPKIVQWVIRHSGGYVRNEKQAASALMIFVVLAVIFSLSMFLRRENTVKPAVPSITGAPAVVAN